MGLETIQSLKTMHGDFYAIKTYFHSKFKHWNSPL